MINTTVLNIGTEEEFFQRGKQLARAIDAGQAIPEARIISFEDPTALLKLLTTARLALFRTIKDHPDSISGIAERLHRDRSAVKRDVDQLAQAGLVTIEQKILPGHGRMKQVKAAATAFRLEAQLF